MEDEMVFDDEHHHPPPAPIPDIEREDAMLDSDDEHMQSSTYQAHHNSVAMPSPPSNSRRSSRRSLHSRSKARPIRSPSSPTSSSQNIPPQSPPTPAPSPSPHHRLPDWSTADEQEESFTRSVRTILADASVAQKERILAEILNMCDNRMLNFVHDFVCPKLKHDPFVRLPNEICLRILSFVDHPRTLARSSQVSRRWHELVNDDMAWKTLCEKHLYRRMSNDSDHDFRSSRHNPGQFVPTFDSNVTIPLMDRIAPPASSLNSREINNSPDRSSEISKTRAKHMSYRSHFKRRYMVETAWRSGGNMHFVHLTPDSGVVTSLHLTDKYIVVALDNAKIHVFDAQGSHQKTLHGHVMGVWAMVPWGDTLVSGGCDRDVRVWDLASGRNVHTLRGHSSTVRCLKMSDENTAITGSRDTTLRIWDVKRGRCLHILVGHQASVRCIEVHGDVVASGSYDTTAKLWSISEGRCLRTLHGHFSQIYAIAFDGQRVCTGSLDTSVRVWQASTGKCLAVLSGHTSLVGQLQMRGDTLVTGGSDGSVRVWSLEHLQPIHRLAAHDNSVTSLQFNESRIVSGGSDGRVKTWDLKTGQMIRELGQPAEAVWRVVFEEEKAVIMANRNQRTIMEVWSFAPPEEETIAELERSSSPMGMSRLMQDVEMDEAKPVADSTMSTKSE